MKELFRNCLSVEERDGWYRPLRFTQGQLEEYAKVEGWKIRSVAASSVCLSFRTVAESVRIKYRLGGMARNWASFDLTVDGVLCQSIEVTDKEGAVCFTLPRDSERELSVYLPQFAEVELMAPEADAPLCPAKKRESLWLALGDSITQGMVARRSSSAYPTMVSEQLGCEVINAGVGGISFNHSELDFIGREPSLITVALGCNDWFAYKSREELKTAVRMYLDKLISLYRCRKIFVILPIWLSTAAETVHGKTFAEHRELIRQVAGEYGFIRIIDGYELLPHDTAFYNDPKDERQVHPGDEGMILYGMGILKRLREAGI